MVGMLPILEDQSVVYAIWAVCLVVLADVRTHTNSNVQPSKMELQKYFAETKMQEVNLIDFFELRVIHIGLPTGLAECLKQSECATCHN